MEGYLKTQKALSVHELVACVSCQRDCQLRCIGQIRPGAVRTFKAKHKADMLCDYTYKRYKHEKDVACLRRTRKLELENAIVRTPLHVVKVYRIVTSVDTSTRTVALMRIRKRHAGIFITLCSSGSSKE